MKFVIPLILMILVYSCVQAEEVIYPLTFQYPYQTEEARLLVAHIVPDEGIQLYFWDPEEGLLTPALSASLYDAQYISSLCNHQAFSFIDSGRLRIKQYNRRSAKALPIGDKKIIESGMVTWINDEECILSAWRYYPSIEQNGKIKVHKTLGVYQLSLNGKVTLLVSSPHYNALYPILLDGSLFYVRETLIGEHEEVVMHGEKKLFELEYSCHGLDIISPDEYLVYTKKNTENGSYQCSLWQKLNDKWTEKKLFEFEVPFIGINDPYQLFTPLRAPNETIIYVHRHILCSYDYRNEKNTIVASHRDHSYLAPRYFNGKIYYGWTSDQINDLVWTDSARNLYGAIPSYTLQSLVWLGPEAEQSEA